MRKKLSMKLKLLLLILLFMLLLIFSSSFVLAAESYNTGTYGSGAYGQAVCGDSVCDASESCSSCKTDCGSCPTTAAGAGGGAGGGGFFARFFGEENISTYIWNNIEAGSTAIIKIDKKTISFTQLDITVKNTLLTPQIKVEKLADNPALPIKTKVYQYLAVDKVNIKDSDIEKVNIKFYVEEKWFEDNNVDKNNIILKIFKDSKWEDLPTQLIPKNKVIDIISNSVSYTAESTTLSYFAVGVKEILEEKITKEKTPENTTLECTESWQCTSWLECIEAKKTRQCNDLNNCGTLLNKPAEIEDCVVSIVELQEKWLNLQSYYLMTVILIVLLFFSYASYHFLKRNTAKKSKHDNTDRLRQLENCIETCLDKGFSKKKIKKELIRTGWPKDLIEERLKK